MRNKNLFDKITDDKSIIEKTYSSHYEYDKTLDFELSNKTNKLENINLIAITAMTKFLDKSLEEIRVDDYRLKRKEITTEFLKKVKKIIPMENIFYSDCKKSKYTLMRKELRHKVLSYLDIFDYLSLSKTCSTFMDKSFFTIKTFRIIKLIKEIDLQEMIDNYYDLHEKYDKFFGIKEKDLLNAITIIIISKIYPVYQGKEINIKISNLNNFIVLKAICQNQLVFSSHWTGSIILNFNPLIYKSFLEKKINEMNFVIKGLKFNEISVDEEGLTLLKSFVMLNNYFKSIDLRNINVNESSLNKLVDIAKNLKELQSITISKLKITEINTNILLNELKLNKSITKLILSGNSFDQNSANALADIINSNKNLTLLDLSNNHLQDEGLSILTNSISKNFSIKSLLIRNNNITDIGLKFLIENLKKNKGLTYLDLGENKITNKGIKLFFKNLDNTGISSLSLLNSQIKGKSLKIMLDYARNIVKLNLSCNELELDSCTVLFIILKSNNNKSFESLILNQCKIDTNGLFWICSGMKKNKTIKTLKLINNDISDEGAKYIARFLKKNETLTEIDLNSNKISDEGLKSILGSISSRPFLKSLNISFNIFTDLSSNLLSEFLFNKSRLKFIVFKTSFIREENYKYLIESANMNIHLEKLVLQIKHNNNFTKMKKIIFELY